MTDEPTRLPVDYQPPRDDGWHPIATAPKDWFDPIDLWCEVDTGGPSWRIPDCVWNSEPDEGEPGWRSTHDLHFSNPTHWRHRPTGPGRREVRSWDDYWEGRSTSLGPVPANDEPGELLI